MLTPDAKLAGVLPCVVSGGRPTLAQRATAKLLASLHGVTADPVWIVREDDAKGYEADGHEVVTYPKRWAYSYARKHWTGLEPLQYGGFTGCCAGREWACLTAEERGCWAVLQLDDNITRLLCIADYAPGARIIAERGGLAVHADVLAAVTLATNGHMTGATLSAVQPSKKLVAARPGFPYSLFIERVGKEREHWLGPVEADIMHAYQYAYSGNDATALVVPAINYRKQHRGGGGMRGGYDSSRAVSLQRLFPQTARVGVRQAHSNGMGEARVFHTMLPGAIRSRTPMVIRDHQAFGRIKAYLADLAAEWYEATRREVAERVASRASAS